MNQSGYYLHPTIHNDTIVFSCEDDLWMAELRDSPRAWKLTDDETPVRYPRFSNDGTQLAFLSQQEGRSEVYCWTCPRSPYRQRSWTAASLVDRSS